QPHPEFASDFVDGLLKTRGKGVVPDDQLEAAKERLHQPTDSDHIAHEIANFFRKVRT
ncbi:type 1 glutamine amidotransferase, partial [Phaeobacter sp. HF9A]|nr:type 1 glutamine amidotransferase [Phaeobacter sp. HF9A]